MATFELGEKLLRKNSEGYWFETTVNDTYLELTKEFPEDYRKSQKGKRTGVEFGAHDVDMSADYHVTSYLFAVGTRYMGSIRFTNAFGAMTVTGDYGNWVFCREFYPNAIDAGVNEQYWLEKLRTYSEQDPYEFDEEETRKEIKSWLDGTHEYFIALFDPKTYSVGATKIHVTKAGININGQNIDTSEWCHYTDLYDKPPFKVQVVKYLGMHLTIELMKQITEYFLLLQAGEANGQEK